MVSWLCTMRSGGKKNRRWRARGKKNYTQKQWKRGMGKLTRSFRIMNLFTSICSFIFDLDVILKCRQTAGDRTEFIGDAQQERIDFHSSPQIKFSLFFFSYSCCCFCLFAALLAGTLRTYQKAGCDAEYISLSCPRGTSISIEVAQYGNTLKGKMSQTSMTSMTIWRPCILYTGIGRVHFPHFVIFHVRTRGHTVTSSSKCSVLFCFHSSFAIYYDLFSFSYFLPTHGGGGEAFDCCVHYIDGKTHTVFVNRPTDTYWFCFWVFRIRSFHFMSGICFFAKRHIFMADTKGEAKKIGEKIFFFGNTE